MIPSNAISLTVPAEREMMLVVRLTTSGALARSGLTVDAVDDLKLAAEEACNCLIRSSGCRELSVTYWTDADQFRLRAQIGVCECGCQQAVGDDEIAVIRCVLLSLTDDVKLDFAENRLSAIELSKRLPR